MEGSVEHHYLGNIGKLFLAGADAADWQVVQRCKPAQNSIFSKTSSLTKALPLKSRLLEQRGARLHRCH